MKSKYKAIIELDFPEEASAEVSDYLHSVMEEAMQSVKKKEWQVAWTLHPTLCKDGSCYHRGSSLKRRQSLNQYSRTFKGYSAKKP